MGDSRALKITQGRPAQRMLRCVVGPVAQLVRAGDSSTMVPSHRRVRSGREEFRETLTVRADGNPEPSRRYTAGRCRDYLSAAVALNDRLERPAPLWGEEIVHSLRKRRGWRG